MVGKHKQRQADMPAEPERAYAELEQDYKEVLSRLKRLQNSENRLATVNEICSLVPQTLEVRQVLSSAIEKVARVMNTEVVLIFRVNQEAGELELVAHRGVSQEFVAAVDKMNIGEGFNGRVVASGMAMIVKDTARDPRLSKEEVRREGLHTQLIVPLRFRGVVIGTLCVAVRETREFQPQEIELVTTIGNVIGTALQNARLYEEQKQLAAALEVSERKYRTLFESANDAIWVHDLKGNIVTANEATARLSGYSVDELVKMNTKSFLAEEGIQLAREIRAKLLQGDTVQQPYDQRLVKKDGTEAILRLTTNLVVNDGQPIGFQHIARDVTEEKRLQENLRFYLQQVVKAQEEERKRIARELHDDTAQVLSSLSRQLNNFVRKKSHLPADDLFFLKDMQVQLSRGLQAVHRFGQDLRPSLLDDLGLLPALRSLVNEIRERDGIETYLEVLGTERRLAPEVELLIFRIVQEALSNVRRHAQASKAQVVIEFTGGKTKLRISDNGRGFQLTESLHDLPRSGKLGLAGILERAQLLGGTLEVQSSPGKGTTLTVKIPS